MDTFEIIINRFNSKFDYSKEFLEEIEGQLGYKIGGLDKRTRPEVLKLFHERGAHWSSAVNTELVTVKVPKILKDLVRISRYNGEGESVTIDIVGEQCYLLKQFINDKQKLTDPMEVYARANELEEKYLSLMAAYQYFIESNK
jgi:hypothetical protein